MKATSARAAAAASFSSARPGASRSCARGDGSQLAVIVGRVALLVLGRVLLDDFEDPLYRRPGPARGALGSGAFLGC